MLSSQVKFSAVRQTDRQTDTRKQNAPDLSMRGHKYLLFTTGQNFGLVQTQTMTLNGRTVRFL